MIFLLCLQQLFAFRPLNLTFSQSKLYKNYLIYSDNESLYYSTLTTPHVQKQIQNNIFDFDINDNQLVVWNKDIIQCYILNDQINQTILQITKQLDIINQNFSNITLTSQYLLAKFQNQTLYVYNIINKQEKYLDQIKIITQNNQSYQEIYRYNEKIAFQYLNTDHKYHQIILNENLTQLNEKIWFSTQNGIFNVQFWNNGTAIFQNQYHINYTVPLNQLFWYHEDSNIKIKYLFTIQDAYVYAIYTNKAICFQYFGRSLSTNYQNIMCMKLEEEYYQLQDINFRYRLQLLMKHNQTNELSIDYYNQCILFTTLSLENTCSMCQNENCKNECHSIKQSNCSENLRVKGSLPFTMISFCFALMVIYAIIEILKFIVKSCALTLQLICVILKFIFYNIPKMCVLKSKRIYLKFQRRIIQLPITNQQECPICLGEIISPQYFPCNRHAACLDCYEQYEATFQNQQIKCPYRDQ